MRAPKWSVAAVVAFLLLGFFVTAQGAAAASAILTLSAIANDDEFKPSTIPLKDGRMLVTWADNPSSIVGPRIRARIVNSAGTAAAAAFNLAARIKRGSASYTPNSYFYSAIQAANGNIYLAWAEVSSGIATRITIRRFGLDTKQIGADVLVAASPNTNAHYYASRPVIVQAANGKLVVIFADQVQGRLLARVYNSNLAPLSALFAITAPKTYAGTVSAVPRGGDSLLLAYYSSPPNMPLSIRGLTLSANQARATSSFPLTKEVGSIINDRELGVFPSGSGLLLGWDDFEDVVIQYFSLGGIAGKKLVVPSTPGCYESLPSFGQLSNGAIPILFDHWCSDDGIHQIKMVTFRNNKLSSVIPVGQRKTSYYTSSSDVGVRANGKVFAVWSGYVALTGESSIYGREVTPP